jgi:methionyl-tRNA formyltransferase
MNRRRRPEAGNPTHAMAPFRVIFMGTARFAIPSLDLLLKSGCTIPAVVTVPDRPRGRGQDIQPSPVKVRAGEAGLRVLQPERLQDPAFADELRTLDPDLIVVVAFRILPRSVFTIPRYGAINLHASLLPRYRGAAPINHALINGEPETGVTTFFLDDAVDTGNLVLQERIPIADDDDAGSLHDKLDDLGAEVVLRTVRLIEAGNVNQVAQDPRLATPAPKIFKDDCRIRWTSEPGQLRNFVRGLSPVPTAFTELEGKVVKIFRLAVTGGVNEPGVITVGQGRLLVGAGSGMVEVLDLQLEGRKRMGSAEFLRGNRVATGDHFV